MNIELVHLTNEYKEQLFEMLTEWKNDIIVNHTDISPWRIWESDFHDFDAYRINLETKKDANNPIINNGGVLENEIEDNGHIEQRYWISL